MKTQLRGSMVALVTPLQGDEVDYSALETLYRIHAAAGTDAVVVCGTTGESATLSHREHEEVIYHAAQFFKNELGPEGPRLIAGTGSNSTREAVSLTRYAAGLEVDAVLVISPYYNKPTPPGQIAHFTAVARAADPVPVILYNVPGRTGLKMTLETTLELAEIPNIAAIKEASGDMGLISEIVRRAPEGFQVISGEDNLTFPMMALGCVGTISVSANIVPERMREMVHSCLDENYSEARTIHQELFQLTEALFRETSPIPVKTALNLMAGTPGPGGIEWPSVGELRMPLVEMSPAGKKVLMERLSELHLLAGSGVIAR